MIRNDLRNIAIIAHVDHGKTTLVDQLLRQSGIFRENQAVQERVMDSGELERERGITILSKNTAVQYGDIRINIVDTPGHADFSGEVERVMKMVDGVLLVVDAYEGPMPQTRFVLSRALSMGHKAVIVVNKMDRPDARPSEVCDEVLELLLDLEADDEQLEAPFVFCSAREGTASLDPDQPGTNMTPLFDAIVKHIPAPEGELEGSMQTLISTIDYNDYVGRIGIGRVERGTIKVGQDIAVCNINEEGKVRREKVKELFRYEGLKRAPIESADVGEIVAIAGVEDIEIGDTMCDTDNPEPLPFSEISEPTVGMIFSVNDSPLAGKEGKYLTTRHLRDRLMRETLSDVSLRVEDMDTPDSFRVKGRGELHLSILIETMRRQGYEMQVSKPEVLFRRDENGTLLEPMERVIVDVPENNVGIVMDKLGQRKAEIVHMNAQGSRMKLEFIAPARGLLGYRSQLLTDTRGEGIINTVFDGYAPYKGDIPQKEYGSLIAHEQGEAVTYGLYYAQDRGPLYIGPGTMVYAGMVVGRHLRGDDIEVNVCRKKHLTSMRNSGSEEALRLTPPRVPTLEQALEWMGTDELVEITPQNIRIRKKILDHTERYRAERRSAAETQK